MSKLAIAKGARLKSARLGVLTLCLAPLMFGCAFTPQQVHFEPQVRQAATITPSPTPTTLPAISLVTSDERTSSAIGSRGLGVGMSAEITTTDDIAALVHGQVSTALTAQGFKLSDASPDASRNELRVEVRNLEYKVTPGIITGHLRAESALKGICSSGGRRGYEHLYRGESTEEVFVVQFAESNAKHLNVALSKALEQLIADRPLTNCLSAL